MVDEGIEAGVLLDNMVAVDHSGSTNLEDNVRDDVWPAVAEGVALMLEWKWRLGGLLSIAMVPLSVFSELICTWLRFTELRSNNAGSRHT
jgi:hypothetical protein